MVRFLSLATSLRQSLGPIYTVRFLSHATSSRQAYDMTYDCRSVLKHVLKCYDIFSGVHNNRKLCRGPVVRRCRMRQKLYRVRADLHSTIFVACDKLTTGLRHYLQLSQRFKTCFKMPRHFSDVHANRKSCRRTFVSLPHATKIVPYKSALRLA